MSEAIIFANTASARKHLRSYASKAFRLERKQVISSLPEPYKQQWGKWLLLDGRSVFVLSPYDVSPGSERTMWMDKFVALRDSQMLNLMPHLIFEASPVDKDFTFELVSPADLQYTPSQRPKPNLPPVVEIHELVDVKELPLCPIDTRILVYWDERHPLYAGTVTEHQGNVSLIRFDTGDEHWLRLADISYKLEDDEDNDNESTSSYEFNTNNSSSSTDEANRRKCRKRKKKVDSSRHQHSTPHHSGTSSCRRHKVGVFSESPESVPMLLNETASSQNADRATLTSGTCKRRKTCSSPAPSVEAFSTIEQEDTELVARLLTRGYLRCKAPVRKLPNGLYARPRGHFRAGYGFDETTGLLKPCASFDAAMAQTPSKRTTNCDSPVCPAPLAQSKPSSVATSLSSSSVNAVTEENVTTSVAEDKVQDCTSGVDAVLSPTAVLNNTSDEVATAAVAAARTLCMNDSGEGMVDVEGFSQMDALKDRILSEIPTSISRRFLEIGFDATDNTPVQILSPFDIDDRTTKATWLLQFNDLKVDGALEDLPFVVKRFTPTSCEQWKESYDLLEQSDFKQWEEGPPESRAISVSCVKGLFPFHLNLKQEGDFLDSAAKAMSSTYSCHNVKFEDSVCCPVKQDDSSVSPHALLVAVHPSSARPTLASQGQDDVDSSLETTSAHVMDIKGQLEEQLSFPSAESVERCAALLKELTSLKITLEILTDTNISVTVRSLKKSYADIDAIAKPLLKKWKAFYHEATERKLELIVEKWREALLLRNVDRGGALVVSSCVAAFLSALNDHYDGELRAEFAEKFLLVDLMLQSQAFMDADGADRNAYKRLHHLVSACVYRQ